MKIAPILRELERHPQIFEAKLVHTGQHYDAAMSDVFFGQLRIPRPDVDLNVGSGSHARQTAAIMTAFEPVVLEWMPDMVLVVGDVNSTLACALVASKLGILVAHIEAGLRSFDRGMPEEINRLLTDQISDLLFVTEPSGVENLRREGVAAEKVFLVGNVMIDTLLDHRVAAQALGMPGRYGLRGKDYALLTLHRPTNVDDPVVFEGLMEALADVARDVPVLFPVHPRTRPAVDASRTAQSLVAANRLRLMDPLGYLEFVGLMSGAAVVLTDSGGIQEETTAIGVPCLTLRTTTERPATIDEGTNRLVGTSRSAIAYAWNDVRQGRTVNRVPRLWDGGAARRIVEVLDRQGRRLIGDV
jgi:UDP-N-acetylglucosamine 2-epimerase (non-hydrolysing)